MTSRPSDDTLTRLRYDADKRSALVAYLIWFFLGYGGVHRMYLGYWVSGLIMLALLAVSALFTLVLIGYAGIGLILVWWLVDALLIPGMTRRANHRLIDRLAR
ncbi:TM2 domain-containing protein [Roseococcus sp. SDR]|uniref:TM2 domain-containing protein n=1 Tax=Roseococcus sp. SDR TaxID=2835532 RepID=UPI001BCE6F79|nr:TM2 domain-containing protein [Roseococcus sp. SDR]MBS7791785.1 TM2 domain-containing protein [Roseococcus sp. SDR]MBV1847099.1 TM2 domain-containing protein [Roseococcus sp. SDR]